MRGFNKQNNKTNPNIYNFSGEFANCSIFLREFKIGLQPILKYRYRDGLHKRLMSLFMQIKSLDPAAGRGLGHVSGGLGTEKGKALLRNFVFTPKVGIRQQLGNPKMGADLSLVWNEFDVTTVNFPAMATHFELMYHVLEYDKKKQRFTTASPPPLRFSKDSEPQRVELKLDGNLQQTDTLHFPVLGIRFLEVWPDAEYACLGQNGMGMEILDVVG